MEKSNAKTPKNDLKDVFEGIKIEFTQLGFSDDKLNFKAWRKSNGNFDLAVQILGEKNQRVIEQINQSGFNKQNEELQAQGYQDLQLNYQYLLQSRGDVNETIKLIEIKKGGKQKQSIDDLIQESGFSEQMEIFYQKGLQNQKRILQALLTTEGDILAAVQLLSQRKDFSSDQYGAKSEVFKTQFAQQLKFLKENGFDDEQKNLKVLLQNDGNKEAALEKLKQKSDKTQRSKFDMSPEIAEGVKFIREQGFTEVTDQKIAKLLVKFDGNREKTIEKLKSQNKRKGKKEQQPKGESEETQTNDKSSSSASDQENQKNDQLERIIRKQKKQKLYEFVTRDWKENQITKLYVDGNNCFMVQKNLRGMCLGKKMKAVELKIAELVREFARIKKIEVFLIYDLAKLVSEELVQGKPFVVATARPQFETSDDALVEMVPKDQVKPENILVVTSDVGLQIRLMDGGTKNIMKSGVFFDLLKSTVGADKFDAIIAK